MRKRMLGMVAAGALAAAPVAMWQAPAGAQADLPGRILRGAAIAAQGLFITDQAEYELGRATAANILGQVPQHPDPALRAYVDRVGKAVAARSERPKLPYQFFVLDQKEANAFAAPGGFVFVTSGALRLMTNEAQLAGVLGHEVAHIARKHSVQAIRKALIAQGVASAVLDPGSSQFLVIAANVAATVILKGFDRNAELEADSAGAAYALRTGYDPRALGGFLDTLARTSGEVPKWLLPVAGHPRSDDRRTRLDALIADGTLPLRPGLVTGEAQFRTQTAALGTGGGAGRGTVPAGR